MTLHELAEQLRHVAYGLDESNVKWDANDQHVARLNRTISDLEGQVRRMSAELLAARRDLQRHASAAKRRTKERAKARRKAR